MGESKIGTCLNPIFLVLTFAVALAWVAALWRARPDRRGVAAAGMILWLSFTGVMSFSGLLEKFDRVPPPMGVLIAVAFVLAAVLAWSSFGTSLLGTVSIPMIVGFQVFRLGVEIFLWWGEQVGLVPTQMTYEGRNWDVVTGLTALPVAWLFMRGTIGRTALSIWNILTLELLLNVVTVAALSFPTPFERFWPASRFVATLPYVWLPSRWSSPSCATCSSKSARLLSNSGKDSGKTRKAPQPYIHVAHLLTSPAVS